MVQCKSKSSIKSIDNGLSYNYFSSRCDDPVQSMCTAFRQCSWLYALKEWNLTTNNNLREHRKVPPLRVLWVVLPLQTDSSWTSSGQVLCAAADSNCCYSFLLFFLRGLFIYAICIVNFGPAKNNRRGLCARWHWRLWNEWSKYTWCIPACKTTGVLCGIQGLKTTRTTYHFEERPATKWRFYFSKGSLGFHYTAVIHKFYRRIKKENHVSK